MENLIKKKNVIYLIGIFSLALFFLIVLSNFLGRGRLPNQEKSPSSPPTPTSVLTQVSVIPRISIVPQTIKTVPTFAPGRGSGVDITSRQAQNSIGEIRKLSSSLPHAQDLKLSTGSTVSIVIPPAGLQDNPWSLMVQIFGIDYAVPSSDPGYLREKNSFKEAANIVFNWMKSKGADPQKIIVIWGDKKFIQDRTEEWLFDFTK